MFSVSVINNSGIPYQLDPNGELAGGVTRYLSLQNFPVPLTIVDSPDPKTVPQNWAIGLFDGTQTYQLGYEGPGVLTITLNTKGAFTASTGFGDPISGQLFPSLPPLPASEWVTISPPNPVYVGTVMTIAWKPVPNATRYTVNLYRDSATLILTNNLTTNSTSYTLTEADIFHAVWAEVIAFGENFNPSPSTTVTYYCGNNTG